MTQPLNDCPLRIGHGYDLHRLKAGGQLVLGGVVVSNELSPVAHSDGDVVFHAIVDALLGAAALGDIGDWFLNTDARWAGASSDVFVKTAVEQIAIKNLFVVNCDVLILAERPRLKEFKSAIAESASRLLDCQVNIKAGTNEGCDAIGRGEAIAAHATVLLSRR